MKETKYFSIGVIQTGKTWKVIGWKMKSSDVLSEHETFMEAAESKASHLKAQDATPLTLKVGAI